MMKIVIASNGVRKVVSYWFAICLLFSPLWSVAEISNATPVYKYQINKPVSEVYDSIYKSLEDARFFCCL